MKIIIAGAGDVGFHLAKLLSSDAQSITIIDNDSAKLAKVENSLDVFTIFGDTTSFRTLKEADVEQSDMFIAVTQFQDTNLTSSMIAKKLGAKKVIARISNEEFLERENQLFVQKSGIDMLISPEQLAALEIKSLIEKAAFSEVHTFENGLLNLFGTIVNSQARIVNKTVKEVSEEFGDAIGFMPIAILRNSNKGLQTIIPRGKTIYKNHDHVYFLSIPEATHQLEEMLNKSTESIRSVMILGGGDVGLKTAKIFSKKNFNVKIIERNPKVAEDLADKLAKVLVICGDGRDGQLMDEERIDNTDAFIAVTGRSETNIMASLMAKSRGVQKTISLVENMDYIHLSQEIGIDSFINKKLLAASAIFRLIRRGKVLDMTNLYDMEAEVLEFSVEENSKIAHKKVQGLNFPKEAILGGIIRGKKSYIPHKDFEILPMDKVVVFSMPKSIHKVENFFYCNP